jgi:hypothetical protein
MGSDELQLQQDFQMLRGTLVSGGTSHPIQNGRMTGIEITFKINGAEYTGQVDGNRIQGIARIDGTERPWSATR